MEGLILLLVPVALLSLAVMAAWMFVDVTFLGGDRKVATRERTSRRWQPPYIGGRELVAWARDTARTSAQRILARSPRASTLTDLTDELHEGATRAMLPQLRAHELRRPLSCPEGGQGEIGVTALEALAIAERIRTTLTYRDRPLRCRPYHTGVALRRLGLSADDGRDEATEMADARGIVEGVEEGFASGLANAGLDNEVYELNAALSIALGKPDSTRRWLDGEAIFAACPRGPVSFPRV